MEQAEVRRKVMRITRRKLRVRKDFAITDDANFVNDLGADSLRSVDLVMEFEGKLDVTIPDEDAQRVRTVGDAVRLIVWIQGGRQGEHPLAGQTVVAGAGPLGTKEMSLEDFGM